MERVFYLDVILGLLIALAVLTASLWAGRQRPAHDVPWAIGLVVLSGRALLSTITGVGIVLATDHDPVVLIGAVALLLMIPAAILRPKWAGIALLISAIVQPGILFIAEQTSSGPGPWIPAGVMLVFYSIPVVVAGVLLIVSTLGRTAAQQRRQVAGTSAIP